jgi:hypothetical protein
VEIIPHEAKFIIKQIEQLPSMHKARGMIRKGTAGTHIADGATDALSDNNLLIVDFYLEVPLYDPAAAAADLDGITGVVSHGRARSPCCYCWCFICLSYLHYSTRSHSRLHYLTFPPSIPLYHASITPSLYPQGYSLGKLRPSWWRRATLHTLCASWATPRRTARTALRTPGGQTSRSRCQDAVLWRESAWTTESRQQRQRGRQGCPAGHQQGTVASTHSSSLSYLSIFPSIHLSIHPCIHSRVVTSLLATKGGRNN